jgi:uncharacterized protein
MPDEEAAPDPLKIAADEEVEKTAAIARGEVPTPPTATEKATAEAEVDASVAETLPHVPPASTAAAAKPLTSLGDADPGLETVREDPPAAASASIGDADVGAETVREDAQPPATVSGALLTADEKTWATAAHAAAAATFVLPFGNILGPLGVWLAKKESSDWVASHALAALNFQITMTLALVVAAISTVAVVGFILTPAVIIADIVYTIRALMKASEGEAPNYPEWSLKLIKG